MSLPRIDSRSSLQDLPQPFNADRKRSPSPMAFAPQLLGALSPRKPKYRTTFIGLVFFVFLSTYIFLVHGSALSPTLALRHADSPAADQIAVALESTENSRVGVVSGGSEPPLADVHNNHHVDSTPSFLKGKKSRHRHHHAAHPPLRLNEEQELAAISSFIASLPQNVIPPTVDSSLPIDPQLVLDFDTRGARASEEVRAMVEEVWSRNPVFVYSKLYSPVSRELKSILAGMYLLPSPTIVDVDTRDDADVLKPILARLTSSPELPLLFVGGKLVGTMDEVRELAKSGELQKRIAAAGAVINGGKKRKHRK